MSKKPLKGGLSLIPRGTMQCGAGLILNVAYVDMQNIKKGRGQIELRNGWIATSTEFRRLIERILYTVLNKEA
ncbi:hypothetical protein BCON_0305g00060 [Botryotinia convoluta]|uniref:Uncharacterized protein n=1 Tax=Botryotinia convoluta TaxID=54673 RepID=A0A4Z1HDK6_9HELO|nr:hypothetical protein BCON_0305g00060 [Botryotinia convoluta]